MKISIIMPLYNAERFLKESLESVLSQTYEDFELLCINDCSDDQTKNIVDEYIKKDARIILLNNEKHFGAAYSRNRGIKEAKGDYIIFLDGDDIFDEEMLELAYNKAVVTEADIVMFEYLHVTSEKINEKRKIYHSSKYINRFCKNPYTVYDILPCEFSGWSTSPCNKLFSKKLIIDNKLSFQTLKNSNDVYFVEMAFMEAERIIQLEDTRVMVYARDHITPTRISYDRDPMCTFEALIAIREELYKRNLWEKAKKYYWYQAFIHLLVAINKTNSERNAMVFYHFLQKEGIDRIISLSERNQNILGSVVLEGFSNILNKEYEKRGIFDEYHFRMYLEDNKARIINLVENYINRNQKIGLWGIGNHGKQFLLFCKDNNLPITCLIDEDIIKQKSGINGHAIVPLNQMDMELGVIIVTPLGVYSQVIDQIHHVDINIEVIDLCEYLYII